MRSFMYNNFVIFESENDLWLFGNVNKDMISKDYVGNFLSAPLKLDYRLGSMEHIKAVSSTKWCLVIVTTSGRLLISDYNVSGDNNSRISYTIDNDFESELVSHIMDKSTKKKTIKRDDDDDSSGGYSEFIKFMDNVTDVIVG